MVQVFTGSNTLDLRDKLQETIAEFQKEHGGSIERFDGLELRKADIVLDAVRSISFLDSRKLVIVKNFAQNKELLEKIEDVVQQTADSTELILFDQKLDKRTLSYKYLQKHTEMYIAKALNPQGLRAWVVNHAKKLGLSCGPSEAMFLIDRAGVDQQMINSELEKLALHGEKVTKDTIELLVDATPQSKVFSMLDALFAGDLRRSTELYKDQRNQGEEPQKIMGMVVWQLQQLVTAKFSPKQTSQALITLGMSPFSAQKALHMCRNITQKNLVFYVQELARIDALSKTSAELESAIIVYFSEVAERQKTTF